MRYFLKVTSATLLALSGAVMLAQSTPAAPKINSEPKPIKSFDLTAIDKSADPCTNFYQYACGGWMRSSPIPSDQAM